VIHKLGKAVRNPGVALAYALSVARGHWVRVSCRVRGVRFEAGRNLRVGGRLVVRGPGRVVFGDNVTVERVVTPWTYARDAVIEVGSNSYLNGTSFGCAESIRIGARAILSDVSISDSDFHSLHINRHDPAAPIRVRPVVLGENVWVGARAGVLPGTTIGDNSVVGFGAVCRGRLAGDMIYVGNPAVPVRPVPGSAAERAESARTETAHADPVALATTTVQSA
jgi:acetyltransferase-like isoleucine patch superfamily enzyme